MVTAYNRKRSKGKKLNKKQKRNLMLAVGAAAVWYFFLRQPSEGEGSQIQTVLEPADVRGGELVSAETYRLLQSQRPGMSYVPAEGSLGGVMQFTPSKTGHFTRNLVQAGGQLMAEIH